MNKYEVIMNEAALNVIWKYGDALTKPEIRKLMVSEVRDISTEYSMQDVRKDCLFAFSEQVNRRQWICPRNVVTSAERERRGRKKNQYMIDNGLHPQSTVDYLREIQPYRAKRYDSQP